MPSTPTSNVTELLRAWSDGDDDARDAVLRVVYKQLRQRAAARLRREWNGTTLQPTELVHEAYLRLVDQNRVVWQNRAQFFALASQMMRRILVDRARARKTDKRSGRWAQVTLNAEAALVRPISVDILDLDAVLDRLAKSDRRKSQIAELRFFGGLSLEEIGETLGLSVATVEREWKFTRVWLLRALSKPDNERSR